MWRYRELLRGLVVRNLKVKYQRSLLGFVWTLVNPLLTVTILVVVFSHVVRIQVPHYWAFLLSGYFVWNFMLQTLNTGTWIFAEHSRLTRSVAFPSEILVFSAAGSRLIEFLAEIALILLALVLLHHHGVPASYVLLPVLILLQIADGHRAGAADRDAVGLLLRRVSRAADRADVAVLPLARCSTRRAWSPRRSGRCTS